MSFIVDTRFHADSESILRYAPSILHEDFDVEIAGGDSRRHILTSMKTPGRRLRSTRLTAAPTLDTSGPVAVETDGESAGVLPATFEIHPGAVNLRV